MTTTEAIINACYYFLAAVIAIMFTKNLFKREKRQGIVYDIVYAYCIIPFLLRILKIK